MKRSLLCMFALIVLVSSAVAHTPLGGLTAAVSPDGKTLVAGGDSRVVYVIDPASLEVRNRIWVKTSIFAMCFSADGSKLLVEDTNGSVFWVNTQNWTIEKELKNLSFVSPAAKADLCAALSSQKEISFLTLSDGAVKGKVTFDKDIAAFAINPDGTKLAVLSKDEKDDGEKVVASADIPKDLKGAARREFEQRNNGKTAWYALFEVPSGKELSRSKTYFTSSSGASMLFDGEDVLVANYSNENARLNAKGDATVFELSNSFNYGIGISRDHSVLATGGLSTGTITKVKGLGMLSFTSDKLPGWPEYFKGFGFLPDGTAFGGTTAHRIIRIKPDGTIDKAAPIY